MTASEGSGGEEGWGGERRGKGREGAEETHTQSDNEWSWARL